MLIEVTSRKNLPDKARLVLIVRARAQGCENIGDIIYEQVPDAEDGKVHKFSADAY